MRETDRKKERERERERERAKERESPIVCQADEEKCALCES